MNAPMLALYLTGGIAVGTLYFASMWWNAGLFGQTGSVRTVIASVAARLVLLSSILTAASLEGAVPLLTTAAGVLIARAAVLRWVRMAPQ